MSKTPKYWNKAKKYLSKKDKVMSILIKKYNSPSETILNGVIFMLLITSASETWKFPSKKI